MGLFLREGFDSVTDKIDYNIDTLRIATDVNQSFLEFMRNLNTLPFLDCPWKYHSMESLHRRGLVQIQAEVGFIPGLYIIVLMEISCQAARYRIRTCLLTLY